MSELEDSKDACTGPSSIPVDEPEPVKRAEIVIGLVGALGTDLEHVEKQLQRALLRVSYKSETVRVSALIGTAFATAELELAEESPTRLDELIGQGRRPAKSRR